MPIYLYKKTHKLTGKKYLGKTTSQDPFKYLGSGKDWVKHLEEFGKDIHTEIIKECESKQELNHWGRYYSDLWNIVESTEWANRIPETGGGAGIGFGLQKTMQTRADTQAKRSNSMKLRNLTVDTKQRRSEAMKKVHTSVLTKEKITGKNNHNYDHTVYVFQGPNGDTTHCTRQELITEYSLEPRAITRLVHGKIKSSMGWRLLSEPKTTWNTRA